MTSDAHMTDGDAEFQTLLELAMGADVFSSDWSHCSRIATYIARMVSHKRTDPLLYANLFSSALNELLETAFRRHCGDGEIVCSVARAGPVDRIELIIPGDAAVREFYQDAIDSLRRPDVAERYIDALLAEGALDPKIGLLELAVDYKARLFLKEESEPVIRLVAELALDQPAI
jgi:hypothetical protein